ncbi:MAG TPA: alpha/beta hydrolase [Sporichthya sp.]|nr:alpha/beta hydrolase [Sporichthya sp.]
MRARTLLSGVIAGVLTAGLTAGLFSAPAQAADPVQVVELPISFAVKNTNHTSVPCASDGKDYTVNGVIVGPKAALAGGEDVTLYLHAVTWNSDYFNLDIPDHNYVRALAVLGHTSIAVDRLGYGKSGKPEGLATCFGSEADVAGQMVDALKSGNYTVAGHKAGAYQRVYLGGSSVGAMIANIAAFTFHNVDGVINQGFGDFAASLYAGHEVFDADSRCVAGGDPGAPKNYVTFAKDTRDTFYFSDATPEVRAKVPAPRPDPCGQIESVLAGIGADIAHLGEINVPVLLVFGTEDAVFPPPAVHQEAARYAGSPEVTVAGIPGASHFPVLERSFGLLIGATAQWLDNRQKVTPPEA